jgi:hypothetical protein
MRHLRLLVAVIIFVESYPMNKILLLSAFVLLGLFANCQPVAVAYENISFSSPVQIDTSTSTKEMKVFRGNTADYSIVLVVTAPSGFGIDSKESFGEILDAFVNSFNTHGLLAACKITQNRDSSFGGMRGKYIHGVAKPKTSLREAVSFVTIIDDRAYALVLVRKSANGIAFRSACRNVFESLNYSGRQF